MEAPSPSQRVEISDLNLASFLRCRGHPFVQLKHNGGRTFFVFEDSENLRQGVLDFANDAPVPVRSFCNTLRDLKALTRSERTSG